MEFEKMKMTPVRNKDRYPLSTEAIELREHCTQCGRDKGNHRAKTFACPLLNRGFHANQTFKGKEVT